jgi:hypothetical protein
MISYLSGECHSSQADTDDGGHHDGQGLKQLVEVFFAQVGSQVVDEAVDLAEAENSQRLKD